jgi:tetratricopeptide (TPR) repeat protein
MERDPSAPAIAQAIHGVQALLWKAAGAVHVDMDAKPEIWQVLARLIARARPGTIVISEPTIGSLRAAFNLAAAPDRDDGACLLLDGERPAAWRTSGTLFVGRRDEMALLQGRLELALAGRGQVVEIVGDPGIGKSRALFEFRRALDSDRVAYLGGRCVSYGRDLPLLPIIELVRRAGGIAEGDSVAVAGDKLRATLAGLGMSTDDTAPYLVRLMGLSEGTDTIRQLSPEALHRRTVEIFRGMALASSRVRPLVLAVEDLHWMDRASEGYMAALVDALLEAPILLIMTYRTGHRVPWSDRSYVAELKLQPLARVDALRVLDAALARDGRAAPLPAATAEAILDRADGNPFFIEELARAIGPQPAALVTVPESVEAVLLARIDRLPDESKAVLQAASVVGRDVPVLLLEAIAPEVEAAKERLRELQRLEYLHERRGAAEELYRFKHALTQEVAYSSVLPEHRGALHARIVAAIERQHAERLGEHTETLAYHAVRGQLWDKAVLYLRQTGVKASDRWANHEADTCFEQALEALKRLPHGQAVVEAIDLRLYLFRVLMALAEYRRCLDHLFKAAELAEALGERRRLGQALAGQCFMLRITGATDEAITVGRQALTIAAELDDMNLAGTTNFALGIAHHTKAQFRHAAACYRESIRCGEVIRQLGRPLPGFAIAVPGWLAWTLESLGEFTEALAVGRRAVQIAEARSNRTSEVSACCYLAVVHLGRGDTAQGLPLLERALEVCRAYDIGDMLAPVTMRLGLVYAQAGRFAEGIALGEEGVAHSEAIQGFTGHPARLAGLAQSYLLAGRSAEAEKTAHNGLALGREQGQPAGEAECLRVLGMIATAFPPAETALAEAYFTQARELAASLEMRPLVAHCHFDVAKLYRTVARHAQARQHLARATTMYREMDMVFWLEEAEEMAR